MAPIYETLTRTFGFEQFLEGQESVIQRLLEPASAIAIFPTGAGKSLCYQLSALHLPGITLVVSPLLSLMKDQVDFMASKNIPAAKLDSGMTREDYTTALQAARGGDIKILLVSVERFKNERFRLQLERMKISLMVVDEAHCISQWGHNFRPDYLKLPAYQREFNIPQVLLLTATATPRVCEDMCRKFGIPGQNVCTTGFFRKNLRLRILPIPSGEKTNALVETLTAPVTGHSIVYVIQQKTAEKVAGILVDRGFKAAAYHAGMKSEDRIAIQNRFMDDRLDIVVATIAFGMGIDKRDIRKVVHYDLPKSIESYSQEIGRAGRDGKVSVCTVLGDRNSVPILENFAYGDTPEKKGLAQVLELIKRSSGKLLEIRLNRLASETDIRMLPLKTMLVYLEIHGIIKPKYVYFDDYPFRLIRRAEEIAAEFAGERNAFVKTLFSHSRTAKVWTRLDAEMIAAATGSQRQRVISALDYFDAKGWIELQPKSSVEVFEVLDGGFNTLETTEWLHGLFTSRESREIERIQRMTALLEAPSCLAAGLSVYFGESLDRPCGVCTACRTGRATRLPGADLPSLKDLDFTSLSAPLFAKIDADASATLITRFLCGIMTPNLTGIRARTIRGFGRLSAYPYLQVFSWVVEQGTSIKS